MNELLWNRIARGAVALFLGATLTGAIAHAEAPPAPTPPTLHIEGRLREKGTKRPLDQVHVYCFPAEHPDPPIQATTDASGRFSIEVPEGAFKWVVSVANYKRFERGEEQYAKNASRFREFFLEKASYLTYETTVYGQTEKRDDKTKSLDQAQFLTVPGANGDPVKAVQNLPGVNRASALSSQVIIEGSSPNDTRYNVDNQSVPIIFHFGGLSSVVIPEAVDHVDYLSAGFGPEYGQSIAGLVNLTVKDPQTDRLHAFVYADLFNAGGMVEGPINDHSSYLLGLRQSYIGYVLRAAVGNNNKNFDLTAVPEFRDTVLEYRNQLGVHDSFKLVTIGSDDTLGFLLKQPATSDPSIRGNFDEETAFFRVIPEWTHQFNPELTNRLSLGLGKDWLRFDLGSYFLAAQETVFTGREELEAQLLPAWKSYWGVDNQLYWSTVNYQLPVVFSQGGVSNPIGGSATNTLTNQYTTDALGVYWRNSVHPADSRWTLLPGVRVSYFNLTKETIPEPRLAVRYALDHGLTLRSAGGLYDEAPPVQDFDSTYGNPGLKAQRAIHGTVGFEKDFREGAATGWTLSNDFFYKYLYDLVAPSTAFVSPSRPEYYDNSGYGHIFGLEALAKYKTTSWEGWLSYTLSRSRRGDATTPEMVSQYDQTHLFTAVGDIEMGRNWKFSARLRYTTGNPYTPITGGTFDADNDVYTPTRGEIYSERMGYFFQADVRFDKKWIFDTWILTAYLDVENVTNRKNPQQINYNYDYTQSATVNGLPILPTLGIKAEL